MSKQVDNQIRRYACQEAERIYQDLGTTPQGLTEQSAEVMRQRYGSNVFKENGQDTVGRRVIRAFFNPFHIILLILALVSVVTDVLMASDLARNASTATIILSMILISGIIRLIQEMRAKRAADQLNRLIHADVSVMRNGQWCRIPAKELVVGDLVSFRAGDRIAADIRLTAASDLQISQAAITGESAVCEKRAETIEENPTLPLTQLPNVAFMATTVISGRGQGIVLAVGHNTLYGQYELSNTRRKDSFQAGANSIAWVMIRFVAVLIPLVFLLLGVTKGKWLESLGFALSISVGLVPEMLPMVVTACLAKGSVAMSKKQTIVKDINAMQSFGSMDVLCMDKTGTLTNESILLEYYMDVLGMESKQVLDFAYLNSAYHSGVRNPIDNAILACQSMPGQAGYYEGLLRQYRKVDEIPFDYVRKSVSVLVQEENGTYQLIVKGEIPYVVSRCASVSYHGQVLPMGEDAMRSVSAVVDEMLQDGMKVIAVAEKNLTAPCDLTQDVESNLTLLGYIAFFDAPKASAKASVAALKRLKVSPKILTGDQAAIAASVCRRVGIDADQILTGSAIDNLCNEELAAAVKSTHVFAELTPGQKMRLVAALQKNGHTVGFLGDGINDIPAMHQADVGISVDTAVDAAKDAADVVMLQKDLNVLEQGILEGRKTFANMRKYIKITASSNFGNIFAIVCASAFLPFLPMTSLQILLLNLLYDILCIVLPWDTVDEEELCTPKEWSGKTLSRFMLSFGPISTFFDMATFAFLFYVLCPMMCGGRMYGSIADAAMQERFIALFQTGWFLESMWTQVLILHFLRTAKLPILQSRPSRPVILVTLAGIGVFTGVTFTKSAALFGLTQLPGMYFVFLLGVVIAYMVLTTLCKLLYQKKYRELT